jgi:hypothetical protein
MNDIRKIGLKKIGRYTIAIVFQDGKEEITIPSPYMDLIKEYAEVAKIKIPNKSVKSCWFDSILDSEIVYETIGEKKWPK